MKKKLAILISLMMVVCFSFAACGGGGSDTDLSDSKYVGEWVARSVSVADEEGDLDGGVWTLTLNGDGTGTFVSTEEDGESESSDITWELTDDGFKTKGDVKLTFTDDGDGIKATLLGIELHFTRPGEEGPDDGAPDAGAKYGYMGQDPAELAVWKYLAEDIGSQYGPDDKTGIISIPVVQIIKTDADDDDDDDDGEVEIYGDFWVFNYKVDGDTLVCVSGGAHPGKFELVRSGDEYTVKEFEGVADGGSYESSARDIFEEDYDKFVAISSDDTAREALRAQGLADYVKTNGLSVTKYQDEGWDPIDLDL